MPNFSRVSQKSLYLWGSKREAAKVTGLSPLTLRDWRLSGKLIENVHWVRVSATCVLYNLELLSNLIANKAAPEIHQAAINEFLASVTSANGLKRGDK